MYGLAVIEGISLSGHLSNIDEIMKIEEQISRENAGGYLKIVNINNKYIHYFHVKK